jgi:hypothetical protein
MSIEPFDVGAFALSGGELLLGDAAEGDGGDGGIRLDNIRPGSWLFVIHRLSSGGVESLELRHFDHVEHEPDYALDERPVRVASDLLALVAAEHHAPLALPFAYALLPHGVVYRCEGPGRFLDFGCERRGGELVGLEVVLTEAGE